MELSVAMGVGSVCLWPSSSRVVRIFSSSLEFMNNPSNSAYAADEMPSFRMPAIERMAPLGHIPCCH